MLQFLIILISWVPLTQYIIHLFRLLKLSIRSVKGMNHPWDNHTHAYAQPQKFNGHGIHTVITASQWMDHLISHYPFDLENS